MLNQFNIRRMRAAVRDEAGAVSVDWVVLTAGVIALNVGLIVNWFEVGLNTSASSINDEIQTIIDGY